ncbi:uncharacterized protein LOC132165051 [Corylus avellana]|uniref:uncharacterized protein LOC132165051 n=1 Tax=Corylus avellana TaxID=13451 RepID=UPI00286C442B|nr:uncharacterized protein LOC132165051 [Corylus avellana]
MERPTRKALAVMTWTKPREGFVKLNWDAAIDVTRQEMENGIIAHDHTGTVLAALCASRPLVTDPAIAEVIAAWKTTKVCKHMGFSKVIIEGDSLEVVTALQGDDCRWNRFGSLVNDTKSYFNSLQEWHVRHTERLANNAAHLLAKQGLTVTEDHLWREDFPLCIQQTVLSDKGPF